MRCCAKNHLFYRTLSPPPPHNQLGRTIMCGIAGIVTREMSSSTELVGRMLQEIRHRGPDDMGVEEPERGCVTLGNVRLAVIDLSTAGHQPMWTADRTMCIAYNGEIYNFQELRTQLQRAGHEFVSESDTEVILAGYQRWNTDVCGHLNGMFAFAIWDAVRQRLFVARDRMGKKPFYYWHQNGTFLFASEIKALLMSPQISRHVDPKSLQCYLALGYSPSTRTMFEGIHKLEAGHLATLSRSVNSLQVRRFWRPPTPAAETPPTSELQRVVRTEVEDAVSRRLIGDVPIGAFLSGGVDSSIVVGVMSRLMDRPVRTFSTAFEVGPRSFKYNVDADAAARVSRHFDTQHTEIRLTSDEILSSVHEVVRALDEPITTPMFQTYLLARAVRQHGVTVVLSGDGSDEVFGGYSRYLRNRMVDALAQLPGGVIRAVENVAQRSRRGGGVARAAAKARLDSRSPARYLSWWEYLDHDTRTHLTTPDVAIHSDVPGQLIQRLIQSSDIAGGTDLIAYLDLLLWIAEDSNMRMDKLCMASSVEPRAPFLDYRVVELGLSIPFARKATWRTGKQLLRDAFSDLLPPAVMARPKWGWWAPMYHWMRGPLGDQARSCLSALPRTGFFTEAVASFQDRVPPPDPIVVWKLMLWALWYDEYIEPIGLSDTA